MKKYSIIYNSITGNTAMLAGKIKELLPTDAVMYYGNEEKVEDSDTVFLGFWVCRGDADEQTKKILPSLHGKSVFLFGTAGFSGGENYYAELLSKITEQLPEDAQRIGGFLCAGKMPEETCLKYRTALRNNPNNVSIMRMLDNFDRSANHPATGDLEKLTALIQKIIKIEEK